MNNNLIIRQPDGVNNPLLEKYFKDFNEALRYLDVSVSHPNDDSKSGCMTLHFKPYPQYHAEHPSVTKYLIERLQEINLAWMKKLLMDPNLKQATEEMDSDERTLILRHYSATILINGKIYSFMWPRSSSMGTAFDFVGKRDQAEIEFAFSKVLEV